MGNQINNDLNHRRVLLYPGSFDPPTSGHHNIALRGLKLCDLLVIGIHMESSSKSYMFTAEERREMFLSYFNEAERQNMRVDLYEGLTAEYASKIGALGLLRGLRTNADFEFEFQMAAMNKHLNPQLETVFIRTEGGLAHVSSSLVKDVLRYRDVTGMVSDFVADKVRAKFC